MTQPSVGAGEAQEQGDIDDISQVGATTFLDRGQIDVVFWHQVDKDQGGTHQHH
jgi:hypothetical protein